MNYDEKLMSYEEIYARDERRYRISEIVDRHVRELVNTWHLNRDFYEVTGVAMDEIAAGCYAHQAWVELGFPEEDISYWTEFPGIKVMNLVNELTDWSIRYGYQESTSGYSDLPSSLIYAYRAHEFLKKVFVRKMYLLHAIRE